MIHFQGIGLGRVTSQESGGSANPPAHFRGPEAHLRLEAFAEFVAEMVKGIGTAACPPCAVRSFFFWGVGEGKPNGGTSHFADEVI